MRFALLLTAALIAAPALAKLPPPSEADKIKAAAAAAKTAWTDKVGGYKTCLAQDKAVANYRGNAKAVGLTVGASTASIPACTDPGPFVATEMTPQANKPLEASGAHSPPGKAVSPPSTTSTAAEIAGGVKKPAPN